MPLTRWFMKGRAGGRYFAPAIVGGRQERGVVEGG